MHTSAFRWVHRTVLGLARAPYRVVELGARDVNGSVRILFKGSGAPWPQYVGVDLEPGPGVDVVADAATWTPTPGEAPDCVVTTEMLEHARDQRAVIANIGRILQPDGLLILTCATDPRPPHSAVDGGRLRPGESYRNVPPGELRAWVGEWADRVSIDVSEQDGDLYCLARKRAA